MTENITACGSSFPARATTIDPLAVASHSGDVPHLNSDVTENTVTTITSRAISPPKNEVDRYIE